MHFAAAFKTASSTCCDPFEHNPCKDSSRGARPHPTALHGSPEWPVAQVSDCTADAASLSSARTPGDTQANRKGGGPPSPLPSAGEPAPGAEAEERQQSAQVGQAEQQEGEEGFAAERRLLEAAAAGDAAGVFAALQAGAEPACETGEGVTPLMLAADAGCAEAVQALLGERREHRRPRAAAAATDSHGCSCPPSACEQPHLPSHSNQPSRHLLRSPFVRTRRGWRSLARAGCRGTHGGGVCQRQRPQSRGAAAAGLGRAR